MRTPPGWLLHPITVLAAVAYVLAGAWLMFTIEEPDGGPSMPVVWLAAMVLSVIVGFVLIRYWAWALDQHHGKLGVVFGNSLFVIGVMALASYYNWLGLNAIGAGERLSYSGPVVARGTTGGSLRGGGRIRYYVKVQPSDQAGPVLLRILEPLYERVEVGDELDCQYRVGRFGAVYHWKDASRPVCSIRAKAPRPQTDPAGQ